MSNRISSFLGGLVSFVLWTIIVWGEIVGNVHAFRQHGVRDGFAAVFVPPWAWYRGIEFFRHRNIENQNSSTATAQESTAQESFPPPTADEQDALSKISSKALEQPLTDEDLRLYKHIATEYGARTGRQVSRPEVEQFLHIMKVTIDYKRELGRCLLASIDQKQLFISAELEDLREKMRQIGMRAEQLEIDFRKIESAGNQTPFSDEHGHEYYPLTREAVVQGLRQVDVADENFKKMAAILQESASRAP